MREKKMREKNEEAISSPKLEKLLLKASRQTVCFLKFCFRKRTVAFTAFVLNAYVEGLKEMPEFNEKAYEMFKRNVVVIKK